MGNLISFISLLLIAACGFLTIYLIIDFFEYLKKYHTFVWRELCFERLFGMSHEDIFFYPVKPLKFIPFLLSEDDPADSAITVYKKRIKLSFMGMIAALFLNFLIRLFT